MRDIARFRSVLHSSAADCDHTGHLVTMPGNDTWFSKGSKKEWIEVDLGAVSDIRKVTVSWGKAYALWYEVLLSLDRECWETAAECSGCSEGKTESELCSTARYVRIQCNTCAGKKYVIRQLEVWGENGLSYELPPIPAPDADGTQYLTGGNWKLCRAEDVSSEGRALSSSCFDDSGWLPAIVPGTVLVSFLKADAIPDPNYDDQQFQISDSYFTADFWYRNHFRIPEEKRGSRVFLNFDAINWKADVYFNGSKLENELMPKRTSIEGAFIRARFDVTQKTLFGQENHLAILVHKNDHPGQVTTQGLAYGPGNNGGLLGADNPTLHASVGWDWLPTIRGRNTGIYGPVSLSFGGGAELCDPWIESKLEMTEEVPIISAEDVTLPENTHAEVPGSGGIWIGKEGDGFIIDLHRSADIGSVTLVWGSDSGEASADLGSRYPALFLLESSDDCEHWRLANALHGNENLSFQGHAGRDSIRFASSPVQSDEENLASSGVFPASRPQKARYLRFTVIKRRMLNGFPVDTKLEKMTVFRDSPEEIERKRQHRYRLDRTKALLVFRTGIRNREDRQVEVSLKGRILPGDIPFETAVRIPPHETVLTMVRITLEDPKLWWPNTYGEPFLYTAEAVLYYDGHQSDRKRFRFGVRRFDAPVDEGLLSLYCNGVRILCKGGNWGMDDGLKQDDAKVLKDKIRLHAEANMTMIRNWVGMTNHPAFYDACDKYGILIWDDFWLANPLDGPDPDDWELFLANAADKIRRVRSHPSVVFYCGRNEACPPKQLDEGLKELTETLDGTRVYFPNSAELPVGSGGGYALSSPGESGGIRQYFNDVSSPALRSERGIPNIPALESVKRFLNSEHLWPINETWALHDLTFHMNGPANTYISALQGYLGGAFHVPEDRIRESQPREDDPVYQAYQKDISALCEEIGRTWTAEDFFGAAQLINYDHHRGMFDALAVQRSAGLLMWMSQSSWPSFMWQSYDYYLDTNGGYFGLKAGCQPTRAVFDPRYDTILAANMSAACYKNVAVDLELYELSGKHVFTRT